MEQEPSPPWGDEDFDFSKHDYVARVNKPFACPAYTEAYGDNGANV